jgi:hypothetical protein
MLRKLPQVNPKDWSSASHDPGTGFPRWRYVREGGAGWQDMKEKMDLEQITQHNAEKLARKVLALTDKATPEEVRRCWRMIGIEAQLQAVNADSREFAEATAEVTDF